MIKLTDSKLQATLLPKLPTKGQFGFSLIELMISMVLGSILMGGALSVFLNSKQTFLFSEEMTSMQENSRFAMEFITRDVRMAGYYGCGSNSVVNTLKPGPAADAWVYNFGQGLVGYDGDDAAFPVAFEDASLPNTTGLLSDAFTVLRGEDGGNSFTVQSHNTNSAVIDLGENHGYSAGAILALSDCDHSTVFQMTGNNPNKLGHNTGNSVSPGNCTKKMGLPDDCANNSAYEYKGDASVLRVVSHAYYINMANNNVPSFYRNEIIAGLTADENIEELAQGVENMQVRYGIDTDLTPDGIANRYVDADDVADWKKVISVRIHLLMRSINEVTSEPVEFRFLDQNHTPSDRFLRREFMSNISIRNRGA